MKRFALLAMLASSGVALAGPTPSRGESSGWMPLSISRSVLWDQSTSSLNATVDQAFPDFPDYSSGMVDDFSTGGSTWRVNRVTTYFTRGVGRWSSDIRTGQLSLFVKAGATPGDSDFVGNLGEVAITLTSMLDGQAWAVSADTSGIPQLQSLNGEFWIGLTPIADFATFGQEFHLLSSLGTVGDASVVRNLGGAFGFGTDWFDAGTLDRQPHADMLFQLEGDVIPAPSTLGVLLAIGPSFSRRRPSSIVLHRVASISGR